MTLLEHAARRGTRVLAPVLAAHDLKRGELLVLLELRTADVVRQLDLADPTGLDPGDLARCVASLEGRGLVTRKADKTDGRQRSVKLTRKGARLADKLVPAIEQAETELFDGMSGRQRDELGKLLRKIP